MQEYFATFPAGCFPIVVKHLKHFTQAELIIIGHDGSSVHFRSSLSLEQLIEIRYFTNVYIIWDKEKPLPGSFIKGKYFRLGAVGVNGPQRIEAAERNALIQQIKGTLNLIYDTHLSRNDFYVLQRDEGASFIGLRLPRARFKRAALERGQLRPELAHILCLTAGLKAKYTVLDMFAGYGAIPQEAIRGFGCHSVIASDTVLQPGRFQDSGLTWHTADARSLSFIRDNSIDRIVTDPPWGVYGHYEDIETLYKTFLQEVIRILKPQGVAVILSGYADLPSFITASNLHEIASWPVLVSGQKATIFKLQKTA